MALALPASATDPTALPPAAMKGFSLAASVSNPLTG